MNDALMMRAVMAIVGVFMNTSVLAAEFYTVSASSSDGHASITPSAKTVEQNSTASFTVSADVGYKVSATIGGNCPQGFWTGSSYTTGAITKTCLVSFSASTVQP